MIIDRAKIAAWGSTGGLATPPHQGNFYRWLDCRALPRDEMDALIQSLIEHWEPIAEHDPRGVIVSSFMHGLALGWEMLAEALVTETKLGTAPD